MNYLAHAWLSFQQPDILVGNMISDFVKGKKQFDYPLTVQSGIRLHRAIDAFTDAHPVTHELSAFFKPSYRLYAGAFADIVYDHFLANDHMEFPGLADLQEFAKNTYQLLAMNSRHFPEPFQKMFPYMQTHNWLYNYRLTAGIEKSFKGLVMRAAYLTESDTAFAIFTDEYEKMRSCYASFFPSLKKYTIQQFHLLMNT